MPDEAPVLATSVRVLLIDGQDRLLLFRFKSDDGDVWMTPGGAVKEGEGLEEAAARILWDQTGVGDIDVGPCVWLRTNLYPWDGKGLQAPGTVLPGGGRGSGGNDQYWDDVEKKV